MFNIFKRKKFEKESNVALTPEPIEKKPERFTKTNVFFFLWNIMTITLYSAYTLFVTYQMAEKTFLSKVIIYLLYAYIAIFVLLILINISRINIYITCPTTASFISAE